MEEDRLVGLFLRKFVGLSIIFLQI